MHANDNLTMTNGSNAIVQRLWNYCNVLRDDGMSYGDYVEQLTYLLFLKMDDEQQLVRPSSIRADLRWASLRTNQNFTLKQNPLMRAALEQFEAIGEELNL